MSSHRKEKNKYVEDKASASPADVISEKAEVDGGTGEGTTVALEKPTKAERRALYEAQRAAKLNNNPINKGTKDVPVEEKELPKLLEKVRLRKQAIRGNNYKKGVPSTLEKNTGGDNAAVGESTTTRTTVTEENPVSDMAVRSRIPMDDPRASKRITKRLHQQKIPVRVETTRKMAILSHLQQYDRPYIIDQPVNVLCNNIGYDFIVLGLKYSDGLILGSNARAVALIIALRKTPEDKELCRDIEVTLRPSISFLNQCRPMGIGMGNIIKFFKHSLTLLKFNLPDDESKETLLSMLDGFYQNRIVNAHNTIVNVIQSKIEKNDVILTFSCSSLVSDILIEAITRKKNIKLVIVDSKPRFEGRKMLEIFGRMGIDCTYVSMSGISYMMNKVDKVLLGAHGLLANGAVMSRIGAAMVTVVANAFNVPVLVCCESYKFSEKAQTDAIVHNELCDPDELITSTPNAPNLFTEWKSADTVCLLNLSYDVILPKFISALVTELGIVPGTSAPIVMRLKNTY